MMASTTEKMTDTFKSEFQEALVGDTRLPPMVLNNFMSALKSHKISYTAKLTANLFLTRYRNRGGLMLSVHRVHTNGAVIHAGGADRNAIITAVSVEIAPHGEQRDITISKKVH